MSTFIDPKWHDNQIQHFTKVLPHYQSYARLMEDILSAACKLYAPLAMIVLARTAIYML